MTSSVLQEELRKFRETQKKNAAIVASAKASQKRPSAKRPAPNKQAAAAAATAAAAERLAKAAAEAAPLRSAIEKAEAEAAQASKKFVPQAIGGKIKSLLDCLFEAERPLTASQLLETTGIDITSPELEEAIKENPKIQRTGELFQYKGEYDIQNKEELADVLSKTPEGTFVHTLKDAYKTVLDDIKELMEERRVWVVTNGDTNEDVVYPSDPAVRLLIDDDVSSFFHDEQAEVSVDDVLKGLKAAGIKPCPQAAGPALKRRPDEDKKKQREKKIRKLQNAHVLDLFKDDPALQASTLKAQREAAARK